MHNKRERKREKEKEFLFVFLCFCVVLVLFVNFIGFTTKHKTKGPKHERANGQVVLSFYITDCRTKKNESGS